jgi:hypothetical protein
MMFETINTKSLTPFVRPFVMPTEAYSTRLRAGFSEMEASDTLNVYWA